MQHYNLLKIQHFRNLNLIWLNTPEPSTIAKEMCVDLTQEEIREYLRNTMWHNNRFLIFVERQNYKCIIICTALSSPKHDFPAHCTKLHAVIFATDHKGRFISQKNLSAALSTVRNDTSSCQQGTVSENKTWVICFFLLVFKCTAKKKCD